MTDTTDLCKRLRSLAQLRQHAISTMPEGFMDTAKAKAVADIEALTGSAAALEAQQARIAEVEREIDGPHGYKHQIATLHRCALEKANALARVAKMEAAIMNIKQATLDGKVCDDVAWYSEIETLHDYCASMLEP